MIGNAVDTGFAIHGGMAATAAGAGAVAVGGAALGAAAAGYGIGKTLHNTVVGPRQENRAKQVMKSNLSPTMAGIDNFLYGMIPGYGYVSKALYGV